MNKEAYENLIKDFEQGACVLILGPEFFMLELEEETLVENLRDVIYSKREKLKDKPYLSEDGFFYVNRASNERKTILNDINSFYADQAIPGYYRLLSELPFKLVINLSPDDYLSKTLTYANRDHELLYYKNGLRRRVYNKSEKKYTSKPLENIENIEHPSIEKPWIFNFVGIYDDKDSMIFTFDALFEFLYSVFPISNIPDRLKLEIQRAEVFLFMGFNYNKWYLKMIFFILHKICESSEVLKTAVFNYGEANQGAVNFFQSQFNIGFHRQNTVEFLEGLSRDCKFDVPIKTPIASTIEKRRILYLSSCPNDIMPLRFDREYKVIESRLKSKNQRERFDLIMKTVTNEDMLSVIDEYSPHCIVISMHGSESDELIMDTHMGSSVNISIEELLKDVYTLSINPQFTLECIIFSSCNSATIASKICGHVKSTIGISGPILEEVMFEFCDGFFDSFFNYSNYELAYQMGKRYVDRNADFRNYKENIKFFSTDHKAISKNEIIQLSI